MIALNYTELGEGRPVIILHGVFGSSDNWISVGRSLSETYRVFLVDQRNHGRSPHLSPHDYPSMAGDMADFMSARGLEQAIVVGHSMGGKTAMHFAAQFPEKVDKLVVVDISPRYYPPHHHQILEGLQAMDLTLLNSRKEADDQLKQHIKDFGVRQFLLKNLYRADGGFAWRINLPLLAEQIEKVGVALPEGACYNGPTLFIGGGKSDYIAASDHADIQGHFPHAQIKEIAGAGHWIHAEKPEAFIEMFVEFVG